MEENNDNQIILTDLDTEKPIDFIFLKDNFFQQSSTSTGIEVNNNFFKYNEVVDSLEWNFEIMEKNQ